MRKLFLAVLLVGGWLSSSGQTNINFIEYFFDSDPGFGNGTSIPVTPLPSHNINLNISTTSLSAGFHTLIVRARHQSGVWGVQESRTVYVAPEAVASVGIIDAMEYYIDSDPGIGNGTSIPITSAAAINITPTLTTSPLSVGFHVLHLRARDTNGVWGIPELRPFYVVGGGVNTVGTVVQLEYFFDSEPGIGAGVPLTVTAGTQVNVSSLISSASLANGFHSISIRARDNDGQWGLAETVTFYVDQFSQISAVEYFVDTDPGEGNATAVTITPGGAVDQNFIISTGTFTAGSHTLGVRAARTDGGWGNTSTSTFTVKDTQTITFTALSAATFGDAPFNLTATTTSGLPLTYTSSDPAVATIAGSTVTITGAGTTVITASQPGDVNYGPATDIQQTLTVNKANQSITFAALPTKTVGDAPFTLTASSTSALSIVYSSSNPAVATISGNTVTIVAAGTTNITASQPGSTNFNAASNVVQTLTVQSLNNPPVITLQPSTAFFTTGPVSVNSTIIVTDSDGTLASASVSISSGFQGSEDQLLFTPEPGVSGSFNSGTGQLLLSGVAVPSVYQNVLRSIRYNNTASSPNTADRTLTFQVNDGSVTSAAVNSTVILNKPPVIVASEKDAQSGGNVAFVVDQVFSDPDNNLDLATLSVTSAQGAAVLISGGIITVNYASIPDYEGTDELTFAICDLAGRCQTRIIAVAIDADIEIFNGVSANDDTVNDFLRVKFLPPGSEVYLFNRWGDLVYEQKEYDNSDPGRRFEGNGSNGDPLTAGTYYYKIKLADGRERTGYMYLKR